MGRAAASVVAGAALMSLEVERGYGRAVRAALGGLRRLSGLPVAPELIATGLVTVALALVAIRFAPFQLPIGEYLDFARQTLHDGKVPFDVLPIGYVAFIAASLKIGGLHALFAAQALCYLVTVWATGGILKQLGLPRRWVCAGCLLVALHPYLLFNVKRIIDNSVLLAPFSLFLFGLVTLRKRGLCLRPAVLTGIAFGALVLIRPNAWPLLLLLPPVLRTGTGRERATAALACALALGGTLAGVSLPMTGRLLAPPENGSYNLFAGANPLSARYLRQNLNAEQSIPAAAMRYADAAAIRAAPVVLRREQHSALYWRLAYRFIRRHPAEYARLAALKLWTLFRPDLRQLVSGRSGSTRIAGGMQCLLALIAPVWLVARLAAGRRSPRPEGPFAIPVAVLYVVPMLLTNADPRLRLPLEWLFLTDLVVLAAGLPGRWCGTPSFHLPGRVGARQASWKINWRSTYGRMPPFR